MSIILKTKNYLKTREEFINKEKEFSSNYKTDVIKYIRFIMDKVFKFKELEYYTHDDLFNIELDNDVIESIHNSDISIVNGVRVKRPGQGSLLIFTGDGTDILIDELSISVLSEILTTLIKIGEISEIINSKLFKDINELYQQGSDFRMNMMKGFNHFNKSQMGGLDILKSRENTEINRMSDEIFDEDDSNDDSLYPTGINYTEVEYEIDLDEIEYETEEDFEVPSEGTNGLNINDTTPKIQKFNTGEYGFGNLSDIQSNTSSPIVKFSNFK